MIWNNIKIALRNLWRNKFFSFINLFGLAIGLACCITLYLYVIDELSYDRHNKNYERIYRLGIDFKFNELELSYPNSSPVMAPTLVRDFPEVVNAVRIIPTFNDITLEVSNRSFIEDKLLWTDSTFCDIFPLRVIEGNPRKALASPRQLVISRSTAMKYFGTLDVLGKLVKVEDAGLFTIMSVVEDMPQNSHFHFHYLTSMQIHFKNDVTNWMNDGTYTYVMLDKSSSASSFISKLPALVTRYIEPELKKFQNVSLKEYEQAGNYYHYNAMPLGDIHLHSHSIYELEPNGDINNVYIFSISSLLILLIACINFTNLSTAKSTQRAREIGVRKTLGSSRGRLVAQFLSESTLLSFFALLVALVLVEAFIPLTNSLIGKDFRYIYHLNPHVIFLFLAIALITGLVAGSYSAFYLSKLDPIRIMKGSMGKGVNGYNMRKVLVGIQFCISIFLFISTFIIHNQMNYIHTKDLGFDKDNVMVLKNTNKLIGNSNFKELIQQYPGVVNASVTTNIPGGFFDGFTIERYPATDHNKYSVRAMCSDYDFIKTMDMKIVKGHFFSEDKPSDKQGVIINQTLAREMNMANPVGEKIYLGFDDPVTILGVIKDFHIVSLHNKISSLVMLHPSYTDHAHMVVRFIPGHKREILDRARKLWEKHSNGYPLDYFFLSDQMAELHRTEDKTMTLFSIFTVLSILVTCLGLLGLSAFTTEQRTKEIGIRKTLGASNTSILHILNKDLLRWMVIAFVLTSPVAWWAMKYWLDTFAYRTSIQWWTFAFAGALTMLIAILTVTCQAWKAIHMNPVEALRDE